MTKAKYNVGQTRRGAFTLLEVLIALAIFALAIGPLVSAYLNTLYTIESVQGNQTFEQAFATIRQQALVL